MTRLTAFTVDTKVSVSLRNPLNEKQRKRLEFYRLLGTVTSICPEWQTMWIRTEYVNDTERVIEVCFTWWKGDTPDGTLGFWTTCRDFIIQFTIDRA